MKGLILKDIYALWKYYKFFLLVICAILVLGVVGGKSMFVIPYVILFITVLPISFLSMDEKSGWSKFCDAMPVSRSQVVSAKYLLCLVFLLAAIVISSVIILITGFDRELLFVTLTVCGGVLLPTSLMLPCAFAFGTDKGRYLGIALAGFIAAMLSTGGVTDLVWLRYLPIVGLVLFPVSWLVSIPLYEWHRKKQ